MPRILLTHTPEAFANYYGDRALLALSEHGTVVRNPGDRPLDTPAALLDAARGVDIIVAHRATPGPAAFFEAISGLRAFCRCAVDVSTIDIPAATAAGVLVTRATPGFGPAVTELALGLMVDLARGISDSANAWRTDALPTPRLGRQLAGATLGVIGFGTIGRRLAPLGHALGMSVLVSDPQATIPAPLEAANLPTLLERSDFVVCLAPALPETAGLMDAAAFARMRPGTFFLNLSRAALVDEAALLAVLDSGHLAGAALDVGSAPDQMPPPILARHPKVIATPHIGGLTREAAEHQAFDTVHQVAALAAGRQPDGLVNPEAWTAHPS